MKLLICLFYFAYISCRLHKNNNQAIQQINSDSSSFMIQSNNGESSYANLRVKSLLEAISFGLEKNDFVINSFGLQGFKASNLEKFQILSPTASTDSLSTIGDINYYNQKQWKLLISDSFLTNGTDYNGWNFNYITKCNDVNNILGGKCLLTNKELTKSIYSIPRHKKILIEAYFHFIGNWKGETGYLKISGRSDNSILWTSRCITKSSLNTNLDCGYPVCKLNVPIRITIDHSFENLILSFGTSINQDSLACDKSYGVSEFRLFIQ